MHLQTLANSVLGTFSSTPATALSVSPNSPLQASHTQWAGHHAGQSAPIERVQNTSAFLRDLMKSNDRRGYLGAADMASRAPSATRRQRGKGLTRKQRQARERERNEAWPSPQDEARQPV